MGIIKGLSIGGERACKVNSCNIDIDGKYLNVTKNNSSTHACECECTNGHQITNIEYGPLLAVCKNHGRLRELQNAIEAKEALTLLDFSYWLCKYKQMNHTSTPLPATARWLLLNKIQMGKSSSSSVDDDFERILELARREYPELSIEHNLWISSPG